VTEAIKRDAADCLSLFIDRGCRLGAAPAPTHQFSYALECAPDFDYGFEDDSEFADDEPPTPEHFFLVCAAAGKKRIMRMLLTKKRVMESFQPEMFEALFRRYADTFDGQTVIELCEALKKFCPGRSFSPEIAIRKVIANNFGTAAVDALRTLGNVNVDAVDATGATLLHIAAQHGTPEVMQYIINWGADPALKDRSGKTAADYLAARRNAPPAPKGRRPKRPAWEDIPEECPY
jgi:hypothetical protein